MMHPWINIVEITMKKVSRENEVRDLFKCIHIPWF